ncbi:hypothetical protein [Pengzhenrongella frigida]|uniref:DUF624 domain-containing protein n=1 Tax=Pengzhenrongella frigida TaxID=1259133 RepID=A0A4Q5N1R7_9MICO|nr:hypothetical protein [Cellulomonas sp. HLT2-17]RYV52122.1 hypothetical protein EUA98_05005 [Cellulomonas sp. HLT2-17]
MSAASGRRERRSWEQGLLAALAYPANLAFAGVATFLLALPLVTALPAAIAGARAMDGWLRHGDDTVFTATFREFAATWRRTLPLGALSLVVVALLGVDGAFLWSRLVGGGSAALLLAAATIPVTVTVALVLLAVPVAATRSPDGSWRSWLVEAGYLVARRPARAGVLLLLTVAFALTCVLVPTVIPFFGLSVPVYLALVSLGPSSPGSAT